MILVSSCLLGIYSKYDGGDNATPLLMKYAHLGRFIPVCPEQLGGLATPRLPVELCGGNGTAVLDGSAQAVNQLGEDVTAAFTRGAAQVLAIARMLPVRAAILKERSPSCGVNAIYDGSFRHVVRPGRGVTASLLARQGIPVYSEEDLTEELLTGLLDLKSTGPSA